MVLTIQFRNICVNITQGTHTLMQILSSVRNKHLLSVYFGQNWEFALKCVYPYYFITIVKFFLPTDSAYCVVLPLCRPCYPLDFIHSFLETNQWSLRTLPSVELCPTYFSHTYFICYTNSRLTYFICPAYFPHLLSQNPYMYGFQSFLSAWIKNVYKNQPSTLNS